jgi:hypothetical protein
MPFTSTSNDPFLPSIEHEAYSQAQFDDLFGQSAPDQPIFSSKNNDILNDSDLSFEDTSLSSSNPSTVSTPDFSSYSFGHQTSTYPHPNIGTAHPYPLEQHQQQTHLHPNRPLPFRTHTDVPYNLPPHPPPGYHRRRSLSTNDADRIAAPPNPTFMRLQSQTPRSRSRSTTPKERRAGLHTRSSSHGRPLKNTIPYMLHGSPYPTPIGTPIGTPLDDNAHVRKRARTPYPRDYEDPVVRHMTDPGQLAQSRHVIEIGAMAVRNHDKIDPRLEDGGMLSVRERVMKKMEDVERYLRQDEVGNQEALRGCEMIREALRKGGDMDVSNEEKGGEEDGMEAPSKMMGEDGEGLFGGSLGENDLIGLLMRENEQM